MEIRLPFSCRALNECCPLSHIKLLLPAIITATLLVHIVATNSILPSRLIAIASLKIALVTDTGHRGTTGRHLGPVPLPGPWSTSTTGNRAVFIAQSNIGCFYATRQDYRFVALASLFYRIRIVSCHARKLSMTNGLKLM